MTNDKTVTIPLALAELITKEPCSVDDQVRRMDAVDELRALLAAPIKPQCWPCWSCHAPVTMANRADSDGNCPHCEAELDLEDWPAIAAPVVERQEPVAWKHTMHYEHGYRFELTDSPENPFGKPDIDYDKSFRVTCEPLYTSPPAPVAVPFPGYPPVKPDRRLLSAPHCPECGHPDCNGQCFGDDMRGDS